MAIGTALAIGAGLGAIGGAFGSKKKSTTELGAYSDLGGQLGAGGLSGQYNQMSNLVNQGPGEQDVVAGLRSQRDLGELLRQYQTGSIDQSTIGGANRMANQLFGARQQALQQSFVEQQQQFSQAAAVQGRNPLDPVFRAKMAQQQTQQQGMLEAEKGAYAAQAPLQFAQQRASVMSGLASQALQNRQALFGLGSNFLAQERGFLAQTANRTESSGGGIGGAISGALGGAGAFASAFPGGFGGGGGAPSMAGGGFGFQGGGPQYGQRLMP